MDHDFPYIGDFERMSVPPEVLIVDNQQPQKDHIEPGDEAYVFTPFDGHEVGDRLTRQELAQYIEKYQTYATTQRRTEESRTAFYGNRGLDTHLNYAASIQRAEEAFGVELRMERPAEGETRIAHAGNSHGYECHGSTMGVYQDGALQGYIELEVPILYEIADRLTELLGVPNAIVPEIKVSKAAQELFDQKGLQLNQHGQLVDSKQGVVHDFNEVKGPSGEIVPATHVIIAATGENLKVISRAADDFDAGSVVDHVRL